MMPLPTRTYLFPKSSIEKAFVDNAPTCPKCHKTASYGVKASDSDIEAWFCIPCRELFWARRDEVKPCEP